MTGTDVIREGVNLLTSSTSEMSKVANEIQTHLTPTIRTLV